MDHTTRERAVEASEAARIARIIIRHSQVRMVEKVEELEADLHLHALRNMRVLEDRQVRVIDRRASERVAPQVAEADILIGPVLYRSDASRG